MNQSIDPLATLEPWHVEEVQSGTDSSTANLFLCFGPPGRYARRTLFFGPGYPPSRPDATDRMHARVAALAPDLLGLARDCVEVLARYQHLPDVDQVADLAAMLLLQARAEPPVARECPTCTGEGSLAQQGHDTCPDCRGTGREDFVQWCYVSLRDNLAADTGTLGKAAYLQRIWQEVLQLRGMVERLSDRVARQSELLRRRAEKAS